MMTPDFWEVRVSGTVDQIRVKWVRRERNSSAIIIPIQGIIIPYLGIVNQELAKSFVVITATFRWL
jgi:hypothetical protein